MKIFLIADSPLSTVSFHLAHLPRASINLGSQFVIKYWKLISLLGGWISFEAEFIFEGFKGGTCIWHRILWSVDNWLRYEQFDTQHCKQLLFLVGYKSSFLSHLPGCWLLKKRNIFLDSISVWQWKLNLYSVLDFTKLAQQVQELSYSLP